MKFLGDTGARKCPGGFESAYIGTQVGSWYLTNDSNLKICK